jgi:hypothetical protein
MTTHPPGHPSGPTGPGRDELEQHHTGIGEPHEHSVPPRRPWCGASAELGGQQPCPVKVACGPGECRIGQATGSETYRSASLPTLADVVADTDRYLAQAEHVIARQCQPATAGGGDPELATYFRQAVALHIAAARRDLERLTNAHLSSATVRFGERQPAGDGGQPWHTVPRGKGQGVIGP